MQKRGQNSPDDGDALADLHAARGAGGRSKKRTKRKNSAGMAVTAVLAGGCDDPPGRDHDDSWEYSKRRVAALPPVTI
jgi:hypothetical protein